MRCKPIRSIPLLLCFYDPKTGETREVEDEFGIYQESEFGISDNYIIGYYYREGNGGCDCNRSGLMYDLDYDDHYPCGDTIGLVGIRRTDTDEEIEEWSERWCNT